MTKHTPGPWYVEPLDARVVVNLDRLVVADVRSPLSEHGREDALLIAAAPDLLAALRAMVNDCAYDPAHPYDLSPTVGSIQKARAALAKAEGRE